MFCFKRTSQEYFGEIVKWKSILCCYVRTLVTRTTLGWKRWRSTSTTRRGTRSNSPEGFETGCLRWQHCLCMLGTTQLQFVGCNSARRSGSLQGASPAPVYQTKHLKCPLSSLKPISEYDKSKSYQEEITNPLPSHLPATELW